MAGYSTSNGHRCMTYRFFLCCVLLIFLVWGCGSDSSEQGTSGSLASASTETGSASFAIQWHTTSAERASTIVKQAMESCESAGVASITCKVYDESQNPIASGGPWNCSDHQGTIEQIPAGSNRMFAVLGWSGANGGGDVVYQGQTEAGITINPGQNTDAGTIDARPFVPAAPVIGDVYGNQINLSWNDLGFGRYRVYRDGQPIADSTSPSYSDTGLSPQTLYCYTIAALDSFGNESAQSDPPSCTETTLVPIWFRDRDGDTYGNPNDSTQAASQPPGYVADNTDCNDSNGAIHPDATEICNDTDDDCDGSTDEDVQNTYYRDADKDTYGDENRTTLACSVPSGYVSNSTDCNDGNGAIHPGATEICNGIDDNCDTEVDEGLSFNTYYEDSDGDGYGNPANAISECEQPSDYVTNDLDCDDGDDAVNPGEKEVCYDGIDNNCNGVTDNPCDVIVVNPTSSFTARLIGQQNVLVGDANDQEGKPFNSTSLYIKEGTSDRLCLEFNITSQPVPSSVTLDFQMSSLDDPAYSMITLYHYNANGLANAEDYFQVYTPDRIRTFSDYGAAGTNSYSLDITNAYLESIKRERTFMGILLKADDEVARYDVDSPILTLSY